MSGWQGWPFLVGALVAIFFDVIYCRRLNRRTLELAATIRAEHNEVLATASAISADSELAQADVHVYSRPEGLQLRCDVCGWSSKHLDGCNIYTLRAIATYHHVVACPENEL